MPLLHKALLVFLSLLLAILILPGIIQPPPDTAAIQKAQVKRLADALAGALLEYHEAFGQFPAGETGQIIGALRGENEKKAVFFPASESLNGAGELVDPWGTPFRITFDLGKKLPKIQSAGKNRTFEDKGMSFIFSDDFYSWQ